MKCAFRLKLEKDEVCEKLKQESKSKVRAAQSACRDALKPVFVLFLHSSVVLYDTRQQVKKPLCTDETELMQLQVCLFVCLFVCRLGAKDVCLPLLSIVQSFLLQQKLHINNSVKLCF